MSARSSPCRDRGRHPCCFFFSGDQPILFFRSLAAGVLSSCPDAGGSHHVSESQGAGRQWAALRERAVSRRGGSLFVYADPSFPTLACSRVGIRATLVALTFTGKDSQLENSGLSSAELTCNRRRPRATNTGNQHMATLPRTRAHFLFSDIHSGGGGSEGLSQQASFLIYSKAVSNELINGQPFS